MELSRDLIARVQAASMFVKELELMAKQEHTTWYEVSAIGFIGFIALAYLRSR